MHCEGEIAEDPENLPGLMEQFCLNVVPWYYNRNTDVSSHDKVIISKDLVVCPVLWKEQTLAVYSKKTNLTGKEIELPESWGEIHEVQVFELSLEGLKRSGILKVNGRRIKLDIKKDNPLILIPT